MIRRLQFVVIVMVGVVLLSGEACNKKKPQLPSQAKAPADSIAVPLPSEISEETPPAPPPAPPQEATQAEEPKPQPARHHKRKPTQPPATTQSSATNLPASSSSANTTVATAHTPANPANEAPPDTAIAADVTNAQRIQQKQTTTQLLDATEKTLTGLPHSLSHDQEEMVVQIRSYVTQSRKATSDGDFERAYNLATKAHLLCDALVKK